jgi:hypothetical protein
METGVGSNLAMLRALEPAGSVQIRYPLISADLIELLNLFRTTPKKTVWPVARLVCCRTLRGPSHARADALGQV